MLVRGLMAEFKIMFVKDLCMYWRVDFATRVSLLARISEICMERMLNRKQAMNQSREKEIVMNR